MFLGHDPVVTPLAFVHDPYSYSLVAWGFWVDRHRKARARV